MSRADPDGADRSPISVALWVDRQCDAFEAAWRAGKCPRVEDYLGDTSEPERSTLLSELRAAEFELRHTVGEAAVRQDGTLVYSVIDDGPQVAPRGDAFFWEPPGSGSVVELSSLSTLPRESRSDLQGRVTPPQIAGYDIAKELGRGAMGVVYLARQVRLNRLCALKVILSGTFATQQSIQRFLAEAETTAQLQHPNIVRIHATGDFEDRPYFELEYVDGGTLHDRLDGTPWSPRKAAALLERLARGLQAAHERGIVHRDIKPANILMTRDGIPKIADFGLAKSLETEGQTQSGAIIGTPSYMSPEQAGGVVRTIGPAADIYALGALLYELLAARPPFKGITLHDTLHQVRFAEPVSPAKLAPGLPRDLEVICLKCLEKEPERRFASAGDLADELTRFLEHRPIRTRPVSPAVRGVRWCRRNPMLATVGGLGLLALFAAVGVSTWFGIYNYQVSQNLRRQRLEDDKQLAHATLEKAQELCEGESKERGLLQMAHGLEIAHRAESEALERAARLSLATWCENLPRLRGFLDHGAEIELLTSSPDGKLVATAGVDFAVRLWDIDSGQQRHALECPVRVRHLSFSPDGARLLVSASNKAQLVDVSADHSAVTFVHPDTILAVAMSPDGSVLVTAGDDRTVQRWDTKTGLAIGTPLSHNEAIQAVAFNSDGSRIATGSRDGTARVWDVRSGAPLGEVLKHPNAVMSVSFSPDGHGLAVGLDVGGARFWDYSTGKPLSPPLLHRAAVDFVVFHPTGHVLLTGSRDGRVRVWEIADGRIREQHAGSLDHGAPVTMVRFSRSAQSILTGSRDSRARVWSLKGVLLHVVQHAGAVVSTAFIDGDRGVIAAGQERAARLWSLPPDRPEPIDLRQPGGLLAAAFRPDGAMIATAGETPIVRLWETETGNALGDLNHESELLGLCFSPDGGFLATISDNKARWWNVAERRIVRDFEHPYILSAVAVSPDGHRLLTGARDGVLSVWDIATGSRLTAVPAHKAPVTSLAYSPSGSLFLSGSNDQRVILWDASSGHPTRISWRHQGQVWAVAFDRTGATAISGSDDKTLQLWDIASQDPSGITLYNTEMVRAINFSPDGRLLIAGGWNDHATCWDLPAQLRIGPILPHSDPVIASFIRPAQGGFTLWTVSENKQVRRWWFPAIPTEPIARLKIRVELALGMELSPRGERFLDSSSWRERSRRLSADAR